jgi:hypothetical protein
LNFAFFRPKLSNSLILQKQVYNWAFLRSLFPELTFRILIRSSQI